MKFLKTILIIATGIVFFISMPCSGQNKQNKQSKLAAQSALPAQEASQSDGFKVSTCVYKGDTIPNILYPSAYIYPQISFKNDKEREEFVYLVYNIKKVLPIAIMINNLIIETYEYLEALPNDKEREIHIKRVEKGLKEQYTAQMKKLTFKQGKLLIKLIDRQSNQTSYELIKAFMGPFKAFSYQAFAALFGASLRKTYDPQGEDKLTERVVVMVLQGQI